MANNTLILASGSPTFTIPVGGTILTEIYGSSGADNINIEAGAKVRFKSGFADASDKINIKGDVADFKVSVPSALSSIITLIDGQGNTIEIPAGKAGQTLIFDDGSAVLKIDTAGVTLGGNVVTTTASDITTTTDTGDVQDVSADKGTMSAPVTLVDAATGSFNFMEDATVASNVIINHFDSNDIITISNASDGEYSFTSSSDTEVIISCNHSGTVSQILLTGLTLTQLVYDEASFEEAIGFNAVEFA